MKAKRKAAVVARSDFESRTRCVIIYVEYNETFEYFMNDSERFTLTKRVAEKK